MDDINLDINSIEEFENLLKTLLRIEIEDKAPIYDGDDEYYIFSFENLDGVKLNVLEELQLRQIVGNIYIVNKKFLTIDNLFNCLSVYLINKESKKWERIINKIYDLNENYPGIFKSSLRQVKLACKWKGFLTKNITEFEIFISDLYQMIRESLNKRENKEILDNICNNRFWRIIIDYRNYKEHDVEYFKNTKEYFLKIQEIRNTLGIDDSNPSIFTYIKAQDLLLNYLDDFLSVIKSILES